MPGLKPRSPPSLPSFCVGFCPCSFPPAPNPCPIPNSNCPSKLIHPFPKLPLPPHYPSPSKGLLVCIDGKKNQVLTRVTFNRFSLIKIRKVWQVQHCKRRLVSSLCAISLHPSAYPSGEAVGKGVQPVRVVASLTRDEGPQEPGEGDPSLSARVWALGDLKPSSPTHLGSAPGLHRQGGSCLGLHRPGIPTSLWARGTQPLGACFCQPPCMLGVLCLVCVPHLLCPVFVKDLPPVLQMLWRIYAAMMKHSAFSSTSQCTLRAHQSTLKWTKAHFTVVQHLFRQYLKCGGFLVVQLPYVGLHEPRQEWVFVSTNKKCILIHIHYFGTSSCLKSF